MTDEKIFHYEKALNENSIKLKEICLGAAEKESAYYALKDRHDIVVSSLMNDCPVEKTMQAKKVKALSHPDYEIYIEGLAKARKEYLCLRAEEKAFKTRIDALITLISLNKSLIELK